MTSTINQRGFAAPGEEYSGFAKLMHWTIAACVLFMIPAGIAMANLPDGDLKNALYTLHRSTGVLVLALMLIRLAYRLINGVPAPEPTLTTFQRVVSSIVHLALYGLLIAQPIIGWVATSAYGAQISVFGLFTLPAIVAKDEALAKPLFEVHELIGFAIAGLLVMHIGAALFHYFIRRDGVLQRMLP
ncbi:MAG: cytochrome b [Burkholderiales bacterium]|nr:cytochrome b [Phycisphaerae bacterium]